MNHEDQFANTKRWKNRANWVLIGFLAIAAYLLITEHRAHLAGLLYFLPFLFVLACPLMHIFMHGGHGGHHGEGNARERDAPPARQGQGGERKQDTVPTPRHHH